MTLYIVTRGETPHHTGTGYVYRQNVAAIGRLMPLTLSDLRRYVRQFPLSWVTV